MLIKEIPEGSNVLLKQLWESASDSQIQEGKRWYPSAHQKIVELAKTYDSPVTIVCGITARLSPSISWDRNLIATENLLKGSKKIDGYNRNVEIARAIHSGKFGHTDCSISTSFPKNARKIFAFYHNLLHVNKSRHVTIDRWMLRASVPLNLAKGLPSEVQIGSKVYRQISEDITVLARNLQMPRTALQAILWLVIREQWNGKNGKY